MTKRKHKAQRGTPLPRVQLRRPVEADLGTLFDYHLERESIWMAAFPPRDREAFIAHWRGVLADAGVVKKTILCDGRVAGYIVSFNRSGERQVGYWLGKAFWGKGVATQALAQFLTYERARPLVAHVVTHNVASVRVLEKCGFAFWRRDRAAAATGGEVVEEVVLKLD